MIHQHFLSLHFLFFYEYFVFNFYPGIFVSFKRYNLKNANINQSKNKRLIHKFNQSSNH